MSDETERLKADATSSVCFLSGELQAAQAVIHAARALIDALPRCVCGAPATKVWTRISSPRCDDVLCSGAVCDDLPYATKLRAAVAALRGVP